MSPRRKLSEQEKERRWREQKTLALWTCPECHNDQLGVYERELGRLYGTCTKCHAVTLVFVPSEFGYIHAPPNGIIIAED
jgi:hypothetical protein